MHVKAFLVTYAKVLSIFTVGTLAVVSGLYFTGSHSTPGSHKHPIAAAPTHAPSRTPSPAPRPTRTAPVFGYPVAADTRPAMAPKATPTAKPSPAPTKSKPTPTPTHSKPTPAPTPTHTVAPAKSLLGITIDVSLNSTSSAATSARSYAKSVLGSTQYGCLDSIITRESGWRVTATNPTSGAYGLGQALPGSKMASMGADWRTNGVTQVRWVIHYVDSRYGSPCSAWSFWERHRWY